MKKQRTSIVDILTDLLIFLIPAASIAKENSIYFWVITGLDVLIVLVLSVVFLIKTKGKMDIEQILDADMAKSGVIWTAGSAIWALGDCYTETIIWISIAVVLFIFAIFKNRRTNNIQ